MARRDNLGLRDARDRVLDLLGNLGKPAPLRDVEVVQDGLVVPVNLPGGVVIDPGQIDVRYLLRDRHGSAVGAGHVVVGTGGETTLTTPPVTEDITYKVLARKKRPNEREVYLHDLAPIRVGLDRGLHARILAPLLEPAEEPADSDARITDYETAVQVEVDLSQAGVEYDLVAAAGTADVKADDPSTFVVLSKPPKPGGPAAIVLDLDADKVTEDVVLRVRATRRFDRSEHRKKQVALLDVKMPLAVRANPDIETTPKQPIVDHAGAASLTLGDTQPGVRYQLYARTLTWRDFAYGDEPEPIVSVPVPGEPDVQVLRPPEGAPGDVVPTGFLPEGDEEAGTGGDVTVELAELVDDIVVVAVATKEHVGGIPSSIQLRKAAVVLVRPDTERDMALTVVIRDDRLTGEMRVSGGQPGVRYHFREGPGATEPLLPAYFPEPDAGEAERRGIGRTRIGVDFVIAWTATGMDPLIQLGAPISLPVEFHVRAVKAETRVSAPMARTAHIGKDPPVRLEQTEIVTGSSARIVVDDSRPGERYQRFADGDVVGRARNGNGEALSFTTEPLAADTTIVLQITETDRSGWAVDKLIGMLVTVWPEAPARVVAPPLNPRSTSDTSPRLVDYGATPVVEIAASERDVRYRVVAVAGDSTAVVSRRPVAGDGGPIEIPLNQLKDDVELRVRMTRSVTVDDRTTTNDLVVSRALVVAVRADPDRPLTAGAGVVDHGADATVTVVGSQPGTAYRAYVRWLSDAELFPAPDDVTVTVSQGEDSVVVRSPWSPPADADELPAGFTAAGDAVVGAGEDLALPIGALDDDVAVVVMAGKDHAGVASAVPLRQSSAVFVRPDPDVELAFRAAVSGGRLDAVQVSGGQPRVRYHLRKGARGAENELAAYFHGRLDEANRGIDELRVGVDLIPAGGPGADGVTAPPDPVVQMSRRPALPATLHVRASKARTGLSVAVNGTAAVPALPEIGLVEESVEPGAAAHVMIRASIDGDHYALHVDGVATDSTAVGDGSDVELVTDPLEGDALVEVVTTRSDDEGFPVERVVALPVVARSVTVE